MIGLRYNQGGASIRVTYALAETTTEITEADAQSHTPMARLVQHTYGFSVSIQAAPGSRPGQPAIYYLTFTDVKFIRLTSPANAMWYLQSRCAIKAADAELIVASAQ